MIRRAFVFAALVLVFGLACPPTWAQGSSSQPPIFTYVAEWNTPSLPTYVTCWVPCASNAYPVGLLPARGAPVARVRSFRCQLIVACLDKLGRAMNSAFNYDRQCYNT
jgi:hypothetical protein